MRARFVVSLVVERDIPAVKLEEVLTAARQVKQQDLVTTKKGVELVDSSFSLAGVDSGAWCD